VQCANEYLQVGQATAWPIVVTKCQRI